MFFIRWITEKFNDKKVLYLGVSLPGDLTGCIQIDSGVNNKCPLLKCYHEEADHLIYHINHAICIQNMKKIL